MPRVSTALRPGAIDWFRAPYGLTLTEFAGQLDISYSTIARANEDCPIVPGVIRRLRPWLEEHGVDTGVLRDLVVEPALAGAHSTSADK
jgi:hypothetical protein